MSEARGKIFEGPVFYVFMLAAIVVLFLSAHINFFLQDGRPFLDHDWHYFTEGHMMPVVWLHTILERAVEICFPNMGYNNFFLYKLANGFFIIPPIIFIYLTASFMYDRFAGIFAAYFFVTFPGVINVFHKSSVNLLTVCLFSIIIYLYVRSNCFRNLHYLLMFLVSLYVFFLHHYSSLLYLSVLVPVYVFFSFYRLKKNKNLVRKVRYFFIFIFCFFLIDLAFNFARYKGYFTAGMYYFDYHFKVQADSCFSAFLNFFQKCGRNLVIIYNYYFLYFSFYSFFSLLFLICHIYLIFVRIAKKIYFSASEFVEVQFVFMFLGILLLLSTGICKASLFVTPVYFVVAVLNAGIIFKMCNSKSYPMLNKILAFVFVFVVLVHGIASLFYPHLLTTAEPRPMAYYSYTQDDYNVLAYMDFIDRVSMEEDVNFDIIAADEHSEGKTTLFKFYFSLRLKERINSDFLKANYIFVLTDLVDTGSTKEIKSLLSMEEVAYRKILTHKEGISKKNISLKHILPYGFLSYMVYKYSDFSGIEEKYGESFTGSMGDLMPKRDCLVFIYEVK